MREGIRLHHRERWGLEERDIRGEKLSGVGEKAPWSSVNLGRVTATPEGMGPISAEVLGLPGRNRLIGSESIINNPLEK